MVGREGMLGAQLSSASMLRLCMQWSKGQARRGASRCRLAAETGAVTCAQTVCAVGERSKASATSLANTVFIENSTRSRTEHISTADGYVTF